MAEEKPLFLHYFVMVPQNRKVCWINIFENETVHRETIRAVEKYYAGFGNIHNVEKAIKQVVRKGFVGNQENTVCVRASQYEEEFSTDINVYNQVLVNIEAITMYVLQEYVK